MLHLIFLFILLFTINSFAQDKWEIGESTSPMDDSKTVVLVLEANNDIEGWFKTFRPYLVIRCKENKTEIYIHVGMSPNPEYGLYNEYTVRIRLDEAKSFKERWSGSTNKEALFAPRAIPLARQMVKAKRMLFQFVPFNSNGATVEFDISGLDKYLPKVAETCNWKI